MIRTRTPLLVLALTAITLASACSTTSSQSSDAMSERHSINADVSASLSKLYQQAPGSRDLVASAKGVLVFPSVISAGFIVGGSYGKGEMLAGTQVTGYYSTTAGSIGLLAGADSKSVFVFFMTQQAYDQFLASNGWTAGADATVTLISIGADGSVDTRNANHSGVESLVLNNGGLMAGLSIDGTKFSRLAL
jgi:lipid-binding SYLF domain-containing protein